MKVLAACEESQEITRAFRLKGHEAYSCDLKECSGLYPEYHIRKDVKKIIFNDWDLVIACPPCTHLSNACANLWPEKRRDGRQQKAAAFFMMFTELRCKVAIENPVGYMNSSYRKPDQIIHPWQFGHEASKPTCLWLFGLSKLSATRVVDKGDFKRRPDGRRYAAWYGDLGRQSAERRARLRSRTFRGIAEAMADQWGC